MNVQCPLGARFLIDLVDMTIKIGVILFGGDDREVIQAFKDPAIRRGVDSVLRSIATYGVTTPQNLLAPFMVVWNLTNLCNMKCKHCYQRAGCPLPSELTLEEKLKVVEELDKAGVASLAFSGGEPTIHPDYLTVVKAAAKRGFYTAVATNGWKYADIEELKKAVEAGLRYIEVSVDSANPRKHDAFRGVEGSWSRAIKALENAVKLGLSHAMAVTLTKKNVGEVDEILDLAESIGVKRVVFFNFIPVGRGTEIVELDPDPFTREKFMRHIYREMKRRRLEIYTTAPQYGRVVLQMSGGIEAAPTHCVVRGDPITTAIAEFIGGCGAGRIYAAIQPDGVITPCVFMPIPVGSLRMKTFRKIWYGDKLMRSLRDKGLLKGFCGRCPYRNVCGGCRSRAYAYFGDPLGPDPGCIYNYAFLKKEIN
jgi:radical SAM protein with 4Fe4S-binding SPASM domain